MSERIDNLGRLYTSDNVHICILCKKVIPTKIFINEIPYYLGERQKCISCYPFKNPENFYKNRKLCIYCARPSKKTSDKCSSCLGTIRRHKLKLRAIEYKGGKCIACTYNTNPRCLSFHHRDREQKEFSITSSKIRKWEEIQPELDKCDLLCLNCHLEYEDSLSPIPYINKEIKNTK